MSVLLVREPQINHLKMNLKFGELDYACVHGARLKALKQLRVDHSKSETTCVDYLAIS